MIKVFLIFYTFFNLCFIQNLSAQDTLILNDGSEMYVKVLEITENSISYKKHDNLRGPNYTSNLSNVFMAIYKGGKREVFQKLENSISNNENQQKDKTLETKKSTLKGNGFEVRLIDAKNISDNNKSIQISATIEAYRNDQLFTKLYVNAFQKINTELNFRNLNKSYLNKNFITINALSEKLAKLLEDRYENPSGKGIGWALPPNFFSVEKSNCNVVFVEQNEINKNFGFGGGYKSTHFNLIDCKTIENKLLSVTLIWLETNFLIR